MLKYLGALKSSYQSHVSLVYVFNLACYKKLFHDFLSSSFFSKVTFLQNSFSYIIRVSNSLELYQA